MSGVILRGRLRGGLERGRLFLSMPAYKKRIEREAGFKPFEGTLNLEVNREELAAFLKKLKEKKIPGFEDGRHVYGSLSLYKVSCFGEKAAIIKPSKTEHPSNIIEVIGPVKFREKFGLKEGSIVEIALPQTKKKKRIMKQKGALGVL